MLPDTNSSNFVGWKQIALFVSKLAIVAFALYYLFSSDRLRISQLAVRDGGGKWICLALAVCIVFTVVSELRYWVLLRVVRVRVGFLTVIRIGFVSWFCNATLLGGLGVLSIDAVRVGMLMKVSDRRAAILSATFFDRVLGFMGLLLLATVALGGMESLFDSNERGADLELYRLVIAGLGALGLIGFLFLIRGWKAAVAGWLILALPLLFFGAFGGLNTTVTGGIVLSMILLPLCLSPCLEGGKFYKEIVKIPWFGERYGQLLVVSSSFQKKPERMLFAFFLAVVVQLLAVLIVAAVGKGVLIPYSPNFIQTFETAPPVFALSILPLPANGLGVGEAAYDMYLSRLSDDAGNPISGGAAIYLTFRIVMTLAALPGGLFMLAKRSPKVVS